MKDQDSKPFIERKRDHLRLSLESDMEATELNDLHRLTLEHHSLPELNFSDVSIESSLFDQPIATPFFVAGMTAGHDDAETINSRLAEVSAARGWIMGLGSQRRELGGEFEAEFDDRSTQSLVSRFPNLKLISNLGISQLIELHASNQISKLIRVIEKSRACLIAIHLNPLQEAIQAEGTPRFKGAFEALEALIQICPIPVLLKETGSGLGASTLQKIKPLQLFAVDVSGLGGTHWGRIEGKRGAVESETAILGESFKNWGITTVKSVENASTILNSKTEVWASGGVRSGLDAAKLVALGAHRVGFAKPALQAALESEVKLNSWMKLIEKELKIALFCTNSSNLSALNRSKLLEEGRHGSV